MSEDCMTCAMWEQLHDALLSDNYRYKVLMCEQEKTIEKLEKELLAYRQDDVR